MGNKTIKYTIRKNKVWKELIYKGVALNMKAVFVGENRKECEEWIKENVKC